MFNPADLPILVGGARGEWAFVGVRPNAAGEMEFCIPAGFEDFPTRDGEAVNRLFFDLYKIFRRFSGEIRKSSSSQIQNSRGGNTFQQDSVSFIDKEDEVITLYSKIPMLEEVLESYDDLRVFLLTGHDAKTSQINYTRIDRYLSKAIYLEDDTAYIDMMVLPKPVIRYDISDLVRMYCFIYLEIKRALDEQATLPGEVEAQAEIFKGQHLRGNSGLFVDSHNDTITLLKETLAEIERQITWKDADYWYFFRVIERFLYGELSEDKEGEGWGISKFSAVWEAMCIEWAFKNLDNSKILFADAPKHSNKRNGAAAVYIADGFNSPFYLQHKDKKRYLRPDLVRLSDIVTSDELFRQTFQVSKLSTQTYEVKLLKRGKESKKHFARLAKYLAAPGFRRPPPDAVQHIFHAVTLKMYDKAVDIAKSGLSKDVVNHGSQAEVMIVDFKYVHKGIYTSSELNWKAKSDVKKQLVYEAALLLNGLANSVSSQFCLPKFYPKPSEGIGSSVPTSELNAVLQQRGVDVLEVNFDKVKEMYLAVE